MTPRPVLDLVIRVTVHFIDGMQPYDTREVIVRSPLTLPDAVRSAEEVLLTVARRHLKEDAYSISSSFVGVTSPMSDNELWRYIQGQLDAALALSRQPGKADAADDAMTTAEYFYDSYGDTLSYGRKSEFCAKFHRYQDLSNERMMGR